MTKPRSRKLLDPGKAVESYLESLLHDEVEPMPDSKPVTTAIPEVLPLQSLAEQLDQLEQELEQERLIADAEPSHEQTSSSTKKPVDEPESPVSETTAGSQASETATPSELEAPRVITIADRYQFPMQCLMFRVQDQLLSIPLIDMGSVVPWGNKLTSLPHTPDWFLGLLVHREQNVRVVDTARFLRIDDHQAVQNINRHIMVFGEDSWAITCDQLGEVVQLQEQDVKWSKTGGKGMMLGTIKQTLAQLLDPQRLLKQLNQAM